MVHWRSGVSLCGVSTSEGNTRVFAKQQVARRTLPSGLGKPSGEQRCLSLGGFELHLRRGRGRTRTRERARGCARAARARRARPGRRPRPGSRTRGPAGRGWRGVRGSNGEKTGGEAALGARAGSAASARPRTSAWGSCHVANTSDGTPRSARRLAGSAMAAKARQVRVRAPDSGTSCSFI